MEYVQNHLNAKVTEGYENPYGAGRITVKSDEQKTAVRRKHEKNIIADYSLFVLNLQ